MQFRTSLTLNYQASSPRRSPILLRVIKRHPRKLIAIVVLLVLALIASNYGPAVLGRFAAASDVASGHYEVQTFGYPVPWITDYSQLLQQRYSVNLHCVGGCMVSQTTYSYTAAYNDVSITAINRKYGHDIFAECSGDAQQL